MASIFRFLLAFGNLNEMIHKCFNLEVLNINNNPLSILLSSIILNEEIFILIFVFSIQ